MNNNITLLSKEERLKIYKHKYMTSYAAAEQIKQKYCTFYLFSAKNKHLTDFKNDMHLYVSYINFTG